VGTELLHSDRRTDMTMPIVQGKGKAGCQPYAPAAFSPRKYSWYSFLLEAEPEGFYVNEKSTDTS